MRLPGPLGTHVHVRLSRDLPHPLDEAFGWLTDYDDRDHERTDHVIHRRRVLEREGDRILLEATLDVLGRRGTGLAEVTLHPPDRWVARIVEGGGRGSVYRYRLEPREGDGCRLHVDYGIRARRFRSRWRVWLARGRIRRELHRMWDGFLATMDDDLTGEA